MITVSAREKGIGARRSPERARSSRPHTRREWQAYLFVAPALVVLALMLLIPALTSLGFSFTDVSFLGPTHFTGLGNYRALWHDALFRQALFNTAYYTVGTTVPTLVLGLLAAVALNAKFRGRSLLRALFYLPVLTSIVAAAVVWLYLYDPQQGLINGLLVHLGIPRPTWLQSPSTAMPSLIVMAVWREFGSAMLLYLAGLQGIPGELYEAARLDGAGRFRILTRITVPMLRPVTYYLVVMTVVGSFQVFGSIYVMTKGGPVGSTTTVVYDMYQNAFTFSKIGYASAMSTVLFVVILCFSLAGARLLRTEDR
ncbi:sugar ABC transporter permease [Streptomyces sp. NBC_00988]|uniref:carbohydrate ABC transporter permease n=1 Tax=Streptomyces sp. NBC_00988 TaxID=2903704 RepID=UPI003869D602|nr:sugar ABC transporter permease [Streptomyces sp. NBC_00988]